MSWAIKGQLDGLEDVLKRLGRLKQGARNKILRPAVRAAMQPIAKHAKFLTPVRSGMLRKSIGWRVTVYRHTGIVVGLVGPRTGFRKTKKQGRQITAFGKRIKATGINPTRYAHLVELGTYRSQARPFLRPAWTAGKRQAERTIARLVARGLRLEAAK